ncbi:MAG: energy-coupled thiamine transporter ThiT [Anaerococcus sp.]|nr:energy-coupled thiamine transporter ThiT [Anaerococcus sp.]
MNKNWTVKMVVEAGLAIALAFVLGNIKIFTMPQGGSITAGQMIPLVIFALRYGLVKGLLLGAVYGLVDMMIGGYVIHPAQGLLDYPLAFAALGLAGIFSREFMKSGSIKPVFVGTFIGVLVRFVCHVLTGVIFFASYAGEQNVWIYSAIYNGSFLLVEFLITAIIIYLLRNVLANRLTKI